MSEESDIQSAIMDMLTSHLNVSWCFVTTSGRVKISARTGVKNHWVTLGMPGLPDIIGMLRGGISFGIEVKQPGSKPTESQIDFIRHATAHGGRYGWATNVSTAMGIIE